ncbi:hypothetical protein AGABI1DRAFT_109987 [Agaricus bisporus var. burnettii JB137-S8]|uniref:Uncharacterized protein n=1 Tax=Agaricus bisporus var. burnettii (strain JB137-S8 / ATCC MYA-4627 / FGSC 10392) TaxID=597362 RepID=K5XHW8_AGABU|nr:uncharacterized protein AGABI1DRAFT_109987 [Agaricus bisporus var. burnettii JB137-S8]EKM74030.1 hypothetical protein AGABI1DRAFT_109987 [Agaricus bisporus var. burnettii JB137-S8]
MSIALATAFEDIFDAYPDFSIEVWGYRLNAFRDCEVDHDFKEYCVTCNVHAPFKSARTTNHYKRRDFPQSPSHERRRQDITHDVVDYWRIGFMEPSDKECYSGNNFLTLYDNTNYNERVALLPSHINMGPWLRNYGGVTIANDPRLCARLVRAATKHAPIDEYRKRFLKRVQPSGCHGCRNAPETRDHILNKCPCYRDKVYQLRDVDNETREKKDAAGDDSDWSDDENIPEGSGSYGRRARTPGGVSHVLECEQAVYTWLLMDLEISGCCSHMIA